MDEHATSAGFIRKRPGGRIHRDPALHPPELSRSLLRWIVRQTKAAPRKRCSVIARGETIVFTDRAPFLAKNQRRIYEREDGPRFCSVGGSVAHGADVSRNNSGDSNRPLRRGRDRRQSYGQKREYRAGTHNPDQRGWQL